MWNYLRACTFGSDGSGGDLDAATPALGEDGVERWQEDHDSASCHLCKRHVRTHDFADLGGGLCLGGYETASCPYLLQELGITHVLRIMKNNRARPRQFRTYSYMSLDIEDDEKESEKLGAALGKAFAFISQGVAGNGKVYVHCAAGISRSPCICLAFLMKERGLSLEEARALVKRVRPQVCPNPGFEEQLRKLELELHASSQNPQNGWTFGGWLSGWFQGKGNLSVFRISETPAQPVVKVNTRHRADSILEGCFSYVVCHCIAQQTIPELEVSKLVRIDS